MFNILVKIFVNFSLKCFENLEIISVKNGIIYSINRNRRNLYLFVLSASVSPLIVSILIKFNTNSPNVEFFFKISKRFVQASISLEIRPYSPRIFIKNESEFSMIFVMYSTAFSKALNRFYMRNILYLFIIAE